MITSTQQAVEVQQRRVSAGKKGYAKAVRRWFKREYGRAIAAHGAPIYVSIHWPPYDTYTTHRVVLQNMLDADFEGCRRFDEVHK